MASTRDRLAAAGKAMHDTHMDDNLNAAIARLAAFRAGFDDGETICNDPTLTAADVDLILAELRRPEGTDTPATEGDQSLHDAVARSKASLNRLGESGAPIGIDPHKAAIMEHIVEQP